MRSLIVPIIGIILWLTSLVILKKTWQSPNDLSVFGLFIGIIGGGLMWAFPKRF